MLPIKKQSVIELSKILGVGALIISHQSQGRCTSPASHPHEYGLLSLYIVFGNIRGFSLYIPTSRPRLNPTCMATGEPVQRPWIAFIKRRPSILRQPGNYRSRPTAERQVCDPELRSGTMFSIQPSLSTTSQPPSVCSGLVQSPLLGYICDGDESWFRQETPLHWRQKRVSSISHYLVALWACMVVLDHQSINRSINHPTGGAFKYPRLGLHLHQRAGHRGQQHPPTSSHGREVCI